MLVNNAVRMQIVPLMAAVMPAMMLCPDQSTMRDAKKMMKQVIAVFILLMRNCCPVAPRVD